MPNKPLTPAPEGYHTVNPWIIPKGAAKLIEFLENVFEARESEEARIPDTDGLIIHSEVKIGDSVIMIFDSKDDWPPTPAFLQVYVSDATKVLGRAKKAGSEIITELTEAWYGEKLARFRDPWGNLWWVHERIAEVDWETEAAEIEEAFQEAADSGNSGYIYNTLMKAMREIA
jgi:PhnB protein